MSATAIEKLPLNALVSLNREEVDLAISTAKQFPRSIERACATTLTLVTHNPEFAALCVYAIPRGGKIIEGPSVRFAECLAHSWGNLTVGARVAEEQAEHIVAQGVAHDLESNIRYTFEVKRRITDRDGNRYNADMVGTTGNAACAIALRNAILRVVPRALWGPIYDRTREVIGGKQKPVNAKESAEVFEKRAKALDFLRERYNLSEGEVCRILKVGGTDQIGADQIVILRGLATALQDGEITVDQALRGSKPIPAMPKPKRGKKAKTHRAPKASSVSTKDVVNGEIVEDFLPPDKPKKNGPITTDQYRDLMIWLGEHGLDATHASRVARGLGYAGSLKELPWELWAKLNETLEKSTGR